MIEIHKDFWQEVNSNVYDAICCTTNQVVKNNGELVMGAGIAKLFKERYSSLPREWGQRLLTQNHDEGMMITKMDTFYLVAFPTKYDWRDPSDIFLIKRSAICLANHAKLMDWKKVLLPRPGCSNGGLDWKRQVKPVLEEILIEDTFITITQ